MTIESTRLLVSESNDVLRISLNQSPQQSTITYALLTELHEIFDKIEQNQTIRFVILQSETGSFCTGLDLAEASLHTQQSNNDNSIFKLYMSFLQRLSNSSKVIVCLLDGQALAGGIGLVAASDFVISTERAKFSLSEALWGLLPCCVLPYLIRRVGYQKAFTMTLTSQSISASSAHAIGLIDLISSSLEEDLHKFLRQVRRVAERTIKDLKSYFRKMWIITEEMESLAITEIERLLNQPITQQNIDQYLKFQILPWEK